MRLNEEQGAGREGAEKYLLPPRHFSQANMVAILLDRKLIPMTREHTDNNCTAGKKKNYLHARPP